jgi:hypothetical protein
MGSDLERDEGMESDEESDGNRELKCKIKELKR